MEMIPRPELLSACGSVLLDGYVGTRERNLVFLAHFDWDTHFLQFHKELMREFTRLGWNVLWVSGPMHLRRETAKWFRHLYSGLLQHCDGLWHYQPWSLPGRRFRARAPVVDKLIAHQVSKIAGRLRFNRPIVLAYAPAELRIMQALAPSVALYWTGDEVIMPGEEELLEYVDAILAVSPPCFEEKRRQYPAKTFLSSTGVPFDMFQAALSSDYVPPDVRSLRHPVVGYAGHINSVRLDLELLFSAARVYPTFTFALVGPSDDDAKRKLRSEAPPNVLYLGCKRYEELAFYLRAFDVGLIPYLLTKFNLGSNPLKLWEYLAVGLPVVATAIPAIERFSGVVRVARNPQEFQQHIASALAEGGDPKRISERIELAREHSVKNVAGSIVEIIERIKSP